MNFVLGNVPDQWVPLASNDIVFSVVTQGCTRFATANLVYPGLRCITPSAYVSWRLLLATRLRSHNRLRQPTFGLCLVIGTCPLFPLHSPCESAYTMIADFIRDVEHLRDDTGFACALGCDCVTLAESVAPAFGPGTYDAR